MKYLCKYPDLYLKSDILLMANIFEKLKLEKILKTSTRKNENSKSRKIVAYFTWEKWISHSHKKLKTKIKSWISFEKSS